MSVSVSMSVLWNSSLNSARIPRQKFPRSISDAADQPPLTHVIRLKLFGHIARADPSMDDCRALKSSVIPLPRDWNCRSGRPRQTWLLYTVESDVAPLNVGLAAAYHRAQNRQAWRSLVETTSRMMMMMILVGTPHTPNCLVTC